MVGQIELLKVVHWGSKYVWTNQEAENCYVSFIYLRDSKNFVVITFYGKTSLQ